MNKVRIFAVSMMVALGLGLFLAPQTQAVDVFDECNGRASSSEVCGSTGDSAENVIGIIINTLLWAVGITSVISIIISGFIYVTSGGDSGQVTKAKNTLTYAIVGLVVAVIAYAIVNWVLKIIPNS